MGNPNNNKQPNVEFRRRFLKNSLTFGRHSSVSHLPVIVLCPAQFRSI